MNEIFDIRRFWNYFRFDLGRTWRTHTKTALLLGGGSLIVYLFFGFLSLLFEFHWTSAPLEFRITALVAAISIIEIYMAKVYGFVTDRKEGSDFLLLPASTLEKWVSMLVICLVIIPAVLLVAFLAIDNILCLIDPHCGEPLLLWLSDGLSVIAQRVGLSTLFVPVVLSALFNCLYFLLCGLLFRRYKILNAFLMSIALVIVLSWVLVIAGEAVRVHTSPQTPEEVAADVENFRITVNVFTALATAGVAALIYRRLRRITQ